MSGLDLKNHFSLSSSNLVSQICSPSLSTIGITYFNYIKIYKDGSRELLTNNSEWIEYFYQKELYKTAGIVDIEYLLPKGYFLWSELKTYDPAYSQGREIFNIDNGVSFVIKKKDETILFIFGSTKENHSINNFYVKNIDLFKRFILYFNDKGSQLLKEASQNKIYLPQKQEINNITIRANHISEQKRLDFLDQTEIERYFILDQENNLYLTKREAECIAYMINGATAKKTARMLDISFRTVQSHIYQVKEKLQCANKDELEKILIDACIHDVILPRQNLNREKLL